MANRRPGRSETTTLVLISLGSNIISTTANAPIDRVKLLMQCQNEMVLTGRLDHRYRGIVNCMGNMFKTEGFFAFWRGNIPAVCQNLLSSVTSFATKDFLANTSVFNPRPGDSQGMILSKNIMRGSAAGILSFILVYSLNYSRVRLACDVLGGEKSATRQFKGMTDVYKKTLASDGTRGLYRGFWVAATGVVVYRGFYFGLYDTLKPTIARPDGMPNILGSFALGYGVTLLAGTLAYPLDTICRRMMMRSCEPVKYKSGLDCARFIIKNEGFRPFMNGYGVVLFRTVFNAALLVGYDMFRANSRGRD